MYVPKLRSSHSIYKTISLLGMLTLLLFAEACQLDKGKDIPDVSQINVEIDVRRFEEALFSLDTTQFGPQLQALQEQYPEFGYIFFEQLLGSTDPRIAPQGHEAYVRGFVTDSFLVELYQHTQAAYPDTESLEAAFADAFRFFTHYFPDQPTPTVTTFVSEFTISNFIYGENDLAVGLDFFLGDTFPYGALNPGNPNFSAYLTRSFNEEHLVAKTLFPLAEDLAGPPMGNRLLEYMIHNGKKRYVLEQLIPYAPDSVVMEYSAQQLQWCEDNEWEVWAYLLDEELLYSTRYQDFRKLVEHSPTGTSQMPPESPGRAGNYIGKKIIEAYMRRFPDTTLPELLALEDAQFILDQSRYRPPR
jgi:hypothetical protein